MLFTSCLTLGLLLKFSDLSFSVCKIGANTNTEYGGANVRVAVTISAMLCLL